MPADHHEHLDPGTIVGLLEDAQTSGLTDLIQAKLRDIRHRDTGWIDCASSIDIKKRTDTEVFFDIGLRAGLSCSIMVFEDLLTDARQKMRKDRDRG
ncbi:MAG: hypothetical protein V3S43_06285 [Acidimicrobiia bacterium]